VLSCSQGKPAWRGTQCGAIEGTSTHTATHPHTASHTGHSPTHGTLGRLMPPALPPESIFCREAWHMMGSRQCVSSMPSMAISTKSGTLERIPDTRAVACGGQVHVARLLAGHQPTGCWHVMQTTSLVPTLPHPRSSSAGQRWH